MNNTSATLTSATAAFVAGDAGKRVMVYLGAGVWLAATINTVNSGTSVTLSAAATSSITNAVCLIATDDSAAAKAQLADANTYWIAHSGATELTLDPLLYGIAVAPTVGGATLGNAQIPLPLAAATGGKFQPQWVCSADVTPLMDFQQTVPESAGAFLACMSTAGTSDGTFGPSYMIGGPIQGYGGEPGLFNNVFPSCRGVGLLLPWNTSIGGWDLFSCAGFDFENWAVLPMGVVTGSAVPLITSPGALTNTWNISGLRAACAGNNDDCKIGHGSVEGMVYGIMPSEHSVTDEVEVVYCITGLEFYCGISAMVHPCRVNYASVEGCINGIGTFDSAKIDVAVLDTEALTSIIRDPGSALNGYVGMRGDVGNSVPGSTGILFGGSGGLNLKIVNLNNGPGVPTPPSVPATGVALVNGYYRDATVYITGAMTGNVKINGTSLGTSAAGPYRVPSGASITLTYSSAPTWVWVLE